MIAWHSSTRSRGCHPDTPSNSDPQLLLSPLHKAVNQARWVQLCPHRPLHTSLSSLNLLVLMGLVTESSFKVRCQHVRVCHDSCPLPHGNAINFADQAQHALVEYHCKHTRKLPHRINAVLRPRCCTCWVLKCALPMTTTLCVLNFGHMQATWDPIQP